MPTKKRAGRSARKSIRKSAKKVVKFRPGKGLRSARRRKTQ